MCLNCDHCECDCDECDDRTEEQVAIENDPTLTQREKFMKYMDTLNWPEETRQLMIDAYNKALKEGEPI